jgi:7-carboxy-7-deazaguanine synthase
MSTKAKSSASTAAATLPIAETFVSIQGEGKLTGMPSWFARTAGCNLRCTWCDTPYTSWSPQGGQRTIDELVDEALATGMRHAVLTGGEPMLFPEIVPLAERLAEAGMHATIETAGTVDQKLTVDLMSLSPKLANSTPTSRAGGQFAKQHEERRINIPVLQKLIERGRDVQFKYVVQYPSDVREIELIMEQLEGWRPEDVLLMPQGYEGEPSQSLQKLLVGACLKHGWRYCDRLHIRLFGNKRGT